MNAKLATVSAIALALASASQASAQNAQPVGEKGYADQPLAAPVKGLELVVGTGYTQGFGSLQKGVDMDSVATPGIAVDLGVGYRIDAHWALSIAGEYQELTAIRATGARGFTAGVAAAYHFSPYTRMDPWVQLATGYRFLWETQAEPQPSLLSHGFELAKLTVGVDFRVNKDIALAPVIGADLTLPLWQSVGGASSVAISDPRVSTFVFAGLQARFDVTDWHETKSVVAQSFSQTTVTGAKIMAPPPPEPHAVIDRVTLVSPNLAVSEELLAACSMNLGDVGQAPKFEFDKSDLLPADEDVLKKIAECFISGPLQGAGVMLTGRADPRGTVQYNDSLGFRRANNVANYLEHLGLSGNRIDRISRGERDATGTNEATWAIDRRVDITLSH